MSAVCTEQEPGRETGGELACGSQGRLDCSAGPSRRLSRTDRSEAEHQGESRVISVRRGR